MEQDPNSPPTFWLQPPQTTTRHRKPPIDPVVLIILIPIIALVFLFFFLPPFLSYTSHILKPASVKSTWDSLNIFLVLFAILCGVLARRNDDVSSSNENSFVTESSSNNNNRSVDHSSGEWIGFSERKAVSGGLQRSCSSYPDLRQESLWEDVEIRNRFYDDSSPVSRYYNNLSRRIATETEFSGDNFRRREPDLVEFSDVKEIVVDTFEVSKNSRVTPPPPPPPPPSAKAKRHSFRSVARKIESDEFEKLKTYTPTPGPPPPPPPPQSKTVARVHKSRNKHTKLERKVSDATKEIATAISSLYNQKKRKSKLKLRNISSSSDSSPPSVHFGSPETEDLKQRVTRTPLPPPPPPPPPPTMFQNLFKKGGKHKRIHSVSPTVPPPPPPPLPSSIFNNIFKSGDKSKRFQSPSTAPPPPPLPPSSIMNNFFKTGTKSKRFNSSPPPPPPPPPRYTKSESRNRHSASNGKPPLPTKTSYYEREEFLSSSSQSPLIPMPPPPPPFRMSAMKFDLRGDFVRIRSTHSSVCSSPDRDDGSGSRPEPLFFPSPDVNAKADSFISRLKDEWRMEKINHVKDKMG